MNADNRAPDDEVDELFDDLELDESQPPPEVHSAVTMRPAPSRVPSGGGQLRVLVSAPVRAAADAPAARVTSPPPTGLPPGIASPALPPAPPTVPASLKDALATIQGTVGVVGYACRNLDGETVTYGSVGSSFADRIAYLTRLATLVGDELGLEGLREIQAAGAQQRLAAVLSRDGSSIAVLASADATFEDLSGRRR